MSLPDSSAPAPGGGGSGVADEGRGKLYRDNNPAARLWGRQRGSGGGLAQPRLAERPGAVAVRCAGRAGCPEPEAPGGCPFPSPSPVRVELVFRVPLDGAGFCFSPRQEVSFALQFRAVSRVKSFFFFGGDPSRGWETPAKLETRKPARTPTPTKATYSSAGGESTSALTRERNSAGSKVTNEGKEIMSSEALKKLP